MTRVMLLLATLAATTGCIRLSDLTDPIESLATSAPLAASCNLTVRAEPPYIHAGETARLISRVTNCGSTTLHFTQRNGCGFAPTMDGQDDPARNCAAALVPYSVAPHAFIEQSWSVGSRFSPGPHAFRAHAGMSGEYGPEWDAEGELVVLPVEPADAS